MHEAFGERMKGGNALDRMLAGGRLGRKNGRGFYRYGRGRRRVRTPRCTVCSASGRPRAR